MQDELKGDGSLFPPDQFPQGGADFTPGCIVVRTPGGVLPDVCVPSARRKESKVFPENSPDMKLPRPVIVSAIMSVTS